MPKKLRLRIDGELVSAIEGETILQAARKSSKYIPTLCYLKGLSPVGACRVCMVEVSGIDRLVPACTTPIQEGMSVVDDVGEAGALPEDHAGAAARGAEPRLRGVRVERPLRAANDGVVRWGSRMCGTRTTIPSCRWTSHIRDTC